ncbi:MAG: hypothetical protein ACLT16_17995 [[Clostridium] innocuum]
MRIISHPHEGIEETGGTVRDIFDSTVLICAAIVMMKPVLSLVTALCHGSAYGNRI